MTMDIIDDGSEGFGSEEALSKRFFTIGETNNDATESTIGKYGKGGYKSVINLAKGFKITSYFNNKKHEIETDIVTMVNNNKWTPTSPLNITKSPKGKMGTEFNIDLLPKYHSSLNEEDMIRNLSRAYHKIPMEIKVNGKKVGKMAPYGSDIQAKKEYHIFWKNDGIEGKFVCLPVLASTDSGSETDEEDEVPHATLTLFVIRNIVTDYENLGPLPGVDIYRLDRLCNSDRPIHHLGKVSEHLGKGEGSTQGKR